MRYLFPIALIVFVGSGFVSAQTASTKTQERAPAERSSVITALKTKFPREKFDPLRSPKADLEAAIRKASASGRRIILDVGGEWCGWCIYMDKFFIENPSLAKLRDDNFVWIKVNTSPENENKEFLSAYPEATGYPHLFVLDEKGVLLHSQHTDVLENGNGYDLKLFTEFLKKWAPPRDR